MNNKLCECCLGEFDINELKSMTASYTYKDTNEIFSKIINQCFNLKVNQYSRRSNNDMFICDVCIDNLRKANIFKNQIEESQKRLNLMTRRQKYIDRISSPLPAEFDFDDDSGPTQKVKRKLPQNKKSKPLHELIKLNDKSTKTHLCHICGKVVPTAAKLKNHVMTTHKDLRVQCHICKKFVKEYCLKMHMKMHNNIKISKCTVCGEKFKHYFQKRKHEVEVHNISPTIYPCKLCGEKFFNTNRRSIHYRKIHLQLNKYVCQFCNQSFFTGGELKNHLAVHSNERNHKCELCGRLFKRKKTLADHVKVHFINKCEVCSKPFKDKKSLLAHVTTHQFY